MRIKPWNLPPSLRAPCNVEDCENEASQFYLLELDSEYGPIGASLNGCKLHSQLLREATDKPNISPYFWNEDNWERVKMAFGPASCSVRDCEELTIGSYEGWLGLYLYVKTRTKQIVATIFACPKHKQSLVVAVSREFLTICHRAYAFASMGKPKGILFVIESLGAVAVTGINPITNEEILWPFENKDAAVNKLEQSIKEFSGSVQTTRLNAVEGTDRGIVELCPRCGTVVDYEYDKPPEVGKASLVKGSKCPNCGYTGKPFRIRSSLG